MILKHQFGTVLLALAVVLLLAGCATVSPRGSLLYDSGAQQTAALPSTGEVPGSAGGFPEQEEDPFQVVQEASGLGEETRHPATAPAVAVDLGALSILHMASRGQGNTGGASGHSGQSPHAASTQGPGRWTYKTPTTDSKRSLDYQEQVTGRPAWWIYKVGELEFDGIRGTELLEAKGPGYCSFFNADGTPKYWYKNSGKFDEMMNQAERQSKLAQRLGLPVTWHVADEKVSEFLRKEFKRRGLNNTTVHHTRAAQ